jgi:hypothetical protein
MEYPIIYEGGVHYLMNLLKRTLKMKNADYSDPFYNLFARFELEKSGARLRRAEVTQ